MTAIQILKMAKVIASCKTEEQHQIAWRWAKSVIYRDTSPEETIDRTIYIFEIKDIIDNIKRNNKK